jgi:glutamine synthetase
MASQIHAGLDGLDRQLSPARATNAPYAADAQRIPGSLPDALSALQTDAALVAGLGSDFVRYLCRVKQSEQQRFEQAEDKLDFQRREYFSRI